MEQDKPQAKRARFAEPPERDSVAAENMSPGSQVGLNPSCTTGAKIAPLPGAKTSTHQASKIAGATSAAASSAPQTSAPGTTAAASATTSAAKVPEAPAKRAATGNFIANAREAVIFRAVSSPTAQSLAAEITAGGQPVHIDFLHQHFSESELIRGYNGLKITVWLHVRTYHTWIDIVYAAKRPGADKLGAIFDGAFPAGYCKSQDEFVDSVTKTLPTLPDLTTLGDCVGTLPLPPTAFGVPPPAAAASASAAAAAAASASAAAAAAASAAAAAASGAGADAMEVETAGDGAAAAASEADGGGDGSSSGRGGAGYGAAPEVNVRRFQLVSAPPEIKALHARLEPMLLFTIDGAQPIDDLDPSWELLLLVVRVEDGGCLVLGLMTLFNFYAYPANCRLRVSQVLVLSPWQGLGLGKGYLRLAYDLAMKRGCKDLTVEDPTPNLQRVREKLEVEMMRRLDWVVDQAEKCITAVSRGATTWPAWTPPPHLAASPDPNSNPDQPPADPAATAAADAAAAAPAAAGELPAVGGPAGGLPEGVAKAPLQEQQQKGGEGEGPAAGDQDGRPADAVAASAPPPQHPLLACHAFFAALAAVPKDGLAVPDAVQREATAAAESRWRARLAEAEAAANAVTANTDDAAPADAPQTSTQPAGSGSAAAEVAVPANALAPSSAFVSAISRELKMHKGQIRIVWEALLWCHPGALSRPRVRAALEQLVDRRLEYEQHYDIVKAAEPKLIVDTISTVITGGESSAGAGSGSATGSKPGGSGTKSESKAPADATDVSNPITDFFMYLPVARPGKGAPGAAAGSGAAGGAAKSGQDAQQAMAGRLRFLQIPSEERDRHMAELKAERLKQLESMAAVLNKEGATKLVLPRAGHFD